MLATCYSWYKDTPAQVRVQNDQHDGCINLDSIIRPWRKREREGEGRWRCRVRKEEEEEEKKDKKEEDGEESEEKERRRRIGIRRR